MTILLMINTLNKNIDVNRKTTCLTLNRIELMQPGHIEIRMRLTLQRTVSFGDVILSSTGVRNLMTAFSSCSSVSDVPKRNNTRSSSSETIFLT